MDRHKRGLLIMVAGTMMVATAAIMSMPFLLLGGIIVFSFGLGTVAA